PFILTTGGDMDPGFPPGKSLCLESMYRASPMYWFPGCFLIPVLFRRKPEPIHPHDGRRHGPRLSAGEVTLFGIDVPGIADVLVSWLQPHTRPFSGGSRNPSILTTGGAMGPGFRRGNAPCGTSQNAAPRMA